jgi:hypothetical protein
MSPLTGIRPRLLKVLFLLLVSAESTNVSAERLPIKTYTSADGLGSSFVNYLMRDSRGFLWVCTRDGLSRFDGSRFITYQVGDNTAPPGLEQILETRNGIYWIVTTGGLYRFDPAKPLPGTPANSNRPALNVEFVSDRRGFLFEDREGQLWSGGDALYRLKEKDKKLTAQKIDLNLPPDPSIYFEIKEILEGQDQSLWLLTTWGLVRRRPDGKEIFYAIDSTVSNYLTSVLEDSEGRIWLGLMDDVYVIKPETAGELSSTGGVKVVSLERNARPAPAGNHVRLPGKPGEIVKFSEALGIVRRDLKYLYQTSDKHIWISDGDKLTEFDGEVFRPYPSAQGSIRGSAMMIEDGGGNLWLANPTVLAQIDRSGLTSYGTSDGLKGLYVVAINQGRDDQPYVVANDFSVGLF